MNMKYENDFYNMHNDMQVTKNTSFKEKKNTDNSPNPEFSVFKTPASDSQEFHNHLASTFTSAIIILQ